MRQSCYIGSSTTSFDSLSRCTLAAPEAELLSGHIPMVFLDFYKRSENHIESHANAPKFLQLCSGNACCGGRKTQHLKSAVLTGDVSSSWA